MTEGPGGFAPPGPSARRALRSVARLLRPGAHGGAPPLTGTTTLRCGLLDGGEEPADRAAGATDLVHPLGHGSTAVGQRTVAVLVDRTERLVHLDELAVRQPADDTGLDAVLQHLAVVLLQSTT